MTLEISLTAHTHTCAHTHDGCHTITSTRAKRYKADCSDSNTSTQAANKNHAERGIQRDTEREVGGGWQEMVDVGERHTE